MMPEQCSGEVECPVPRMFPTSNPRRALKQAIHRMAGPEVCVCVCLCVCACVCACVCVIE
jgi:hypothetical protein